MNHENFKRVFERLTFRRKEVLRKFLAGETDEAIAQSLSIEASTVRKHLQEICEAFGLKNQFRERYSKRAELMDLFRQHKPELVEDCTFPVKSEVNAVETSGIKHKSNFSNSQECLSRVDTNFVGREEAIAHLNTFVNQGAKVILIHAKGGVGKTTLARKYLQQHFGSYIEFPIAKEPQNITSVKSLIEERLKQLGEEPGREFGVSLDRLKRKLETERIGGWLNHCAIAL